VLVGHEGDRATIEVRDRGPGLDPDIVPRLFEPFVSSRGSTGLGLAVCDGIVREHGGTIAGHNRPGGGASFVVTLPLAPAAAREAS
jgi:signal transduction histidine kinase